MGVGRSPGSRDRGRAGVHLLKAMCAMFSTSCPRLPLLMRNLVMTARGGLCFSRNLEHMYALWSTTFLLGVARHRHERYQEFLLDKGLTLSLFGFV